MTYSKTFTIGGTKYSVEFVENSEKDLGGNLGDFSSLVHEIRVAKNVPFEGDILKLSEEEILKIYLHELGHCFGNFYNGDDSETLANAFSNFLFEYIITKE